MGHSQRVELCLEHSHLVFPAKGQLLVSGDRDDDVDDSSVPENPLIANLSKDIEESAAEVRRMSMSGDTPPCAQPITLMDSLSDHMRVMTKEIVRHTGDQTLQVSGWSLCVSGWSQCVCVGAHDQRNEGDDEDYEQCYGPAEEGTGQENRICGTSL